MGTRVILEVSDSAYEEIKGRVIKAGAAELVMSDGNIDLHGVCLQKEEQTEHTLAAPPHEIGAELVKAFQKIDELEKIIANRQDAYKIIGEAVSKRITKLAGDGKIDYGQPLTINLNLVEEDQASRMFKSDIVLDFKEESKDHEPQ